MHAAFERIHTSYLLPIVCVCVCVCVCDGGGE